MKISKRKLVKLLTDNNISLSREVRKDESALLALIEENGLTSQLTEQQDDVQSVPRGTIEEPETSSNVNDEIEDEEGAMFERMQSTNIENNATQTFNVSDDVKEVTVKNKRTRKVNGKTEKQPEFSSFQVEGYMLLMIVDLILPTGITFVYNMFQKDKSKRIEASDISLKEDQRTSIMPLADSAARSLSMSMNPLTAFGLVYVLSCGANLMMIQDVKKAR